ncbi:MAG: formylglycine-generating enzyme family protein, partial [Candidatus Symbiothrix sp.]|nr:formylglycine-generating enzyme family protein [Candidatus Symbiothrix sp.]
ARGGQYAPSKHGSAKDYYFSNGNDENGIWDSNTIVDYQPQPVGEKSPNALGLYDMSGNVLEWCWNRYQDNVNYTSDLDAGSGTADRVVRGGYKDDSATYCRVSDRGFSHGGSMSNRNMSYKKGIRLALTSVAP